MKEEGGRGTCTTKWTEHGSVKRKGGERSLSHSFGTPRSAPPPLSPLQADKGTEGCSPCTEEGGVGASLRQPPFSLPLNIYRQPVNIVGVDRCRSIKEEFSWNN